MKANTNIDKVKAEWAKQSNRNLKKELLPDEIVTIIKAKSKNEISRLKRKAIIEHCFSIPLLVFMIISFNRSEMENLIAFNIFMVILGLVTYLPCLKLLKLRGTHLVNTSTYLNTTAPVLKSFYNTMKYIFLLAYPFIIAGLILYIQIDFSTLENVKNTSEPITIIAAVAGFIITFLFNYFLLFAFYKPIYYKHIIKLEQLRQEINKTEIEIGMENN